MILSLVVVIASLTIHHTVAQRVLGAFLGVVLVVAAAQDLKRRKIPNWLTGPAALTGLVIGAILDPSGLPQQAFAGLGAGGFLFIFAVIYPKGLGMGDVKLALVIGICLGSAAVVAMLLGLVLAALGGLLVMRDRGVAAGRRVGLPLAPFLALGGVVAILVGPELVTWYTQHESLTSIWSHAFAGRSG